VPSVGCVAPRIRLRTGKRDDVIHHEKPEGIAGLPAPEPARERLRLGYALEGTAMKRVVQAVFLGCIFATAHAQDCIVGYLEIGGPAPRITWQEYSRSRPDWFSLDAAKHYKSLVTYRNGTPFDQWIAVEHGSLVAVIREFTVDHMGDVVDALTRRYGAGLRARSDWVKWSGFSSPESHLAWADPACGLRIDAFQSIDPEDPDERGVVVWTKGSIPIPARAADDAVR